MNDKPIVWMKEVEGGTMYTNYEYLESIPLYTHPAKTLTDEEIEEVFVLNCNLINETFAYRDFAKAILRKAQEK